MIGLLLLLVVSSALAVVYGADRARRLFVVTQRLERVLAEFEVEWGQLQLEQTTWAEHGRIERLGRERLHMTLPPREAVVYLKP